MTFRIPVASLVIGLHLFLGGLPRGVGPGSAGSACPPDFAASALWAKRLSGVYYPSLTCGIPLSGGGCLVAGDLGYPVALDGWIVRLSSAGAIEAQFNYAGLKNDRIHAIAPTADGGYVAAGRTNFNEYDQYGDGWLMKVDKDLVPKWSKTYVLSGKKSEIRHVLALKDGGFCAGGYYCNDPKTVGRVLHGSCVFRTNASGAVQWAFQYYDYYVSSLCQTADQGFLLIMWRASDFAGVLIKLNSAGTIKWAKSYDASSASNFFYSGFVTSAGDIFICGSYSDLGGMKLPSGAGSYYNTILKIAGDGKIKWQYGFTGSPSTFGPIYPAPGGGAYFAAPRGDWNCETAYIEIGKVSAAGALSFIRCYAPFNGVYWDDVDTIFQASDGKVFMLCSYSTTNTVVRFDGSGKTDPKCVTKPIRLKRVLSKLTASDIEVTAVKPKLTGKTLKVTRKATAASLDNACK